MLSHSNPHKKHLSHPIQALYAVLVLLFLLNNPTSFSALHTPNCEYEVLGTTVPNTSGSPALISETSGTVISANFFNSGAINPIDGLEFVSVCVSP